MSLDLSYTHYHQTAVKLPRHTWGHVLHSWISISLISKCICYKWTLWHATNVVLITHKNHLHTFRCTPTLMPKVQAGGNGFLTWNRQPATFHAAPHPPNRHADAPIHTHTHTGGAGQQCHDFTSLANPSSRSAAPTSQLSSPNTLHSISAPCEWFIDRIAFR